MKLLPTPSLPATLQEDSWLSLVAETAGVADCSVARVELVGAGTEGEVRAWIQVRGANGAILGATSWAGDGRELAEGVQVDLGYGGDAAGADSTIVAWLEPASTNETGRDCGCQKRAAPERIGLDRSGLDLVGLMSLPELAGLDPYFCDAPATASTARLSQAHTATVFLDAA